MTTIMIIDETYKKLTAIKGERSFTELFSDIVDMIKSRRNENIMKFAGIMSKSEADEVEKIAKETRKNACKRPVYRRGLSDRKGKPLRGKTKTTDSHRC